MAQSVYWNDSVCGQMFGHFITPTCRANSNCYCKAIYIAMYTAIAIATYWGYYQTILLHNQLYNIATYVNNMVKVT